MLLATPTRGPYSGHVMDVGPQFWELLQACGQGDLSLSLLLLLQAMRHPEVSRRRTSSPNVRGSWLGWFGVHQIVAQKDLIPLVTLPRLVRLSFPGKMVGQEPRKGWHVEILHSITLSSDLHTPLASHCSGGEISNSIQLSYLTSVCTTPYSHGRVLCMLDRLRLLISWSHDSVTLHPEPSKLRTYTYTSQLQLRGLPELALVTVGLYQYPRHTEAFALCGRRGMLNSLFLPFSHFLPLLTIYSLVTVLRCVPIKLKIFTMSLSS